MHPVESRLRSHLTLFLCTVLHAFTHAYGSMLVPLYLLMVTDLHLPGVNRASLLLTVYSFVYCATSFTAGVLTDRFNRKLLLGIGLLGNALAIALIGLTRNYELMLLWAILGGLSGTIFHPAAGALAAGHYPKSPGMAIGLLGIGSGIGFFVGPKYAGWRAQAAHWSWPGMQIAQWQKPCVELGVAGMIVGLLFLLIARETVHLPSGINREPRHIAGIMAQSSNAIRSPPSRDSAKTSILISTLFATDGAPMNTDKNWELFALHRCLSVPHPWLKTLPLLNIKTMRPRISQLSRHAPEIAGRDGIVFET
jgi:MFS family permease